MIIGITGNARHGKDTIANMIKDYINCEIIHFADPMKEASKILMDWTDDHVYGDLKETVDKRWGISPRQFLQWLGTEAIREYLPKDYESYTGGKDHWIRLALEKCKEENKIYVIPDVRFLNEALSIKFCGGIIFKVIRPIETNVPNHSSEKEINLIEEDFLFHNNGTLKDLRRKVIEWIEGDMFL